jgi:hypothetical protein
MWALDVVFSTVWTELLVAEASASSVQVPGVSRLHASVPGPFGVMLSHPILQGKPNASHVCARIILHTHDRQNECNTIAVTNRSRVKPVRYSLLHPERWTQRSEHNDN